MLHYTVHGKNKQKTLVMGSSLGTSSAMWDNIVGALAEQYQVITFDTRGHGQSQHLSSAGLEVKQLAADVIEILDHLDIQTFSYVGLSLGGAIGQQLAIDYPQRVEKLVLCCTAAKFGDAQVWLDRAAKVRNEGMAWLLEPTKGRWYTPGFMETSPFARTLLDEMLTLDAEGYAAVCETVSRFDARADLGRINCPTLAIAGTEDLSTPVAVMQELANGIPNARLIAVQGAAHIGNVEKPGKFLAAIQAFV